MLQCKVNLSLYRHLTDEETRKAKTQSLIDSYQYYFNAISASQSDSIETSTTSFSSSQGRVFLAIYQLMICF